MTRTSAVLAIVLYFSAQFAQALVPGDVVYVADVNTGAIKQFNSAGQGSAFGNVGAVNPVDVLADGSGNLYVANRSGSISGNIDRFDRTGHLILFSSQTDFPSGMAMDSSGTLYAAMVGNNSIYKYDAHGNATLFANSGLSGPIDITFDHNGNLYAINQDTSSVTKFNALGQPSFFASTGQYPSGIACDNAGDLFVANFGDNTVEKIDPTGHTSIFADLSSGLNAPADLAFDESGNLFVLNMGNNTILEFDPSAHGTLFANLGMDHPESLAIYIVPEPSSCALLIWGAGAVFLRRRPASRSRSRGQRAAVIQLSFPFAVF